MFVNLLFWSVNQQALLFYLNKITFNPRRLFGWFTVYFKSQITTFWTALVVSSQT